jgi:hypothetical protein
LFKEDQLPKDRNQAENSPVISCPLARLQEERTENFPTSLLKSSIGRGKKKLVARQPHASG